MTSNTSLLSTPASSHIPSPGYWASLPPDRVSAVLLEQTKRAMAVVQEENLPMPANTWPDWLPPIGGYVRLIQVIKLAVEAEMLFYAAAVDDPTPEARDEFFADFLRRSLRPDAA